MAVYKKTYRPYDGALTSSWTRFLVIPRFAFEDMRKSRFLTIFFLASFIYPLIASLFIYVKHNVSALNLLGVGNANTLISINTTFFLNFLGWQSMLALFLAAFTGPGQVSPDLANNALSLYLARPFSRVEYVLGKMWILIVLMSLMTWVPGLLLFFLEAYLQEGWSWMHDNSSLAWGIFLGFVGLDPDSRADGAGAFRVGEMEARGRRADVRRLLRGRRFRRGHQRRAAHQVGTPVQHQRADRLGLGATFRRRPGGQQWRRVFPHAVRRASCRSGAAGPRLAGSA